MDVKLRLIDNSQDSNNSDIVIFQKNYAASFDNLAVAWKVVKNLGKGNSHPFTYHAETTVSAGDSYGNYTYQMPASSGDLFHMIKDHTGDVLKYSGESDSSKDIQLANDLKSGAISANIFKDGRKLATKTMIAPGQKAVFQLKPVLFFSVASQVVEGESINSGIISKVSTEISLMGISSADVIVTGGGAGRESDSFKFHLDNIVPG